MRYFKATFLWLIVLSAVAGYSYLDFKKMKQDEAEQEEASRLFPFETNEVLSITLEKDGGFIELERWAEGWKIVKPIEAKADSAAVEKFLRNVTMSRNDADYVMDPMPSQERLQEFGLATPTVTLTMRVGKELREYTLLFGERAPTKGVAFAQIKGQPPVYRVLADARSEADKDVYYFRDKMVLTFNPVMVDQLAIIRGEESILLKLPESGNARWTIEKPIKADADHNRVFEFMGSFYNSEVKEFIAEDSQSLEKYGLKDPKAKLSFWQSGDSDVTVSISIGDRNPEKRGYYVTMSDRNNVFLLEEDIINSIPREASDLRSRHVFFLDSLKFSRIEIHRPGSLVTLVKDKNQEWHRDNMAGESLDYNMVKEFLDSLSSIKIRDFVADNPISLREYGLDPPSAQILLYKEEGGAPLYLSLGLKSPAGYLFAQSGSEKSVIALDAGVQGILNFFL